MRRRFVFTLVAIAALAVPCRAWAIAPKVLFSYTGQEQSYVVPSGVAMVGVAAVGGHGGQFSEGGGREGGVGALLPVTPGEPLFAEVGAAGVYAGGPVFGGGGAAGAPPPVVCMSSGTPCGQVYASSGGGASDVRTCSILAATCTGGVTSAATRLIVGGGGGGEPGSGNGPDVECVGNGATGSASNFQYPPGNPGGGHPAPIVTAAGIVYPANYLPDTSQSGITPAGNGSDVPGFGGSQAGCTSGSVTFSDSVAGSTAVGGLGGTGGDASSLGPMYSGCVLSSNNCLDAGPGGGGGGGYFGGGGGATGLDKSSGGCGVCNGAGSGLPGGGGSSFTSNQTLAPVDESNLLGAGNGIAIIVPVVEIDAPANGAVYTPGQVVNASWACAYDNVGPGTDLGFGSGCTGTVANGSPIDTTPGTHTFTVGGTVQSNGNHTVNAAVTYVVKAAATTVRASGGGYTFTLTGPSGALSPASKLTVTVTRTGTSKKYKVVSYSFFIGRGVRHVKHKHAVYTANKVASKPGTYSLSLKGLKAGPHKLKLVITLKTKRAPHKKKTVSLTLPFSVS